MILACIVPEFRLAAALAARLHLWDTATFVVENARGRVLAATPRAQEHGVRAGQTIVQARACVPEGTMLLDDAAHAAQVWTEILDELDCISPFIEDGGEGTAYASLPKNANIPEYIARARAALAHYSLPMQCAAASNRWCARMSALTMPETVCIPGNERDLLARLPVRYLPDIDARTCERLATLGITSMGAFAALPKGQAARRFGNAAHTWHDLTNGIDRTPFTPRARGMRFEQHGYDENGIAAEDRLAFALREITARLAKDLATVGRQCARLRLTFILENTETHVFEVTIAHATAEENLMFHVLQARLENVALQSPICEIRLGAELLLEAGHGNNAPAFFNEDQFDRGALDVLIARLEAVTQQPVQKFVLQAGSRIDEGYRLETFRFLEHGYHVKKTTPQPHQADARADDTLQPQARIMRPPQPITVVCDARGLPLRVNTDDVTTAAGPWKIRERRWDREEAARDEFDVVLRSGALIRIGREGEAWRLYARYD